MSKSIYRTSFNPETKIWSGIEGPKISYKIQSIGELIYEMLQINPNKIGQISDDDGSQFTNHEIKSKMVKCAIHLLSEGYKQGDVIGLIARNSQNLAPVVFAGLLIGAPINPMDSTHEIKELAHMFGMTKPKIIFCDDDLVPKVKESIKNIELNCPIVTIGDRVPGYKFVEDYFEDSPLEKDFCAPLLNGKAVENVAFILGSSGTTGLSKGIMLSHAHMINTFFDHKKEQSNLIICNFSTINWFSGIVHIIYSTTLKATRIITTEPFSPELFLKIIVKYNVSAIFMPPSQLGSTLDCPDIYNHDLSSVHFISCGGAAVPRYYQNAIKEFFINGNVIIYYGLTEIGTATADINSQRIGSVGQVAPDKEIKIVDENGKFLGIGEIGEICVKSAYKYIGYCQNVKLTNDASDDDGFLITGDIGYFDKDGYLFLVDRKKDIIIHKGNRISPTEIQENLLKINGVQMACVVGIPNSIGEDLLAAVIVRKNNNLTEEDVLKYVEENLENYKQLRGGVYFVDNLPMTPSCKIQKHKVLEIAVQFYNNNNNNN